MSAPWHMSRPAISSVFPGDGPGIKLVGYLIAHAPPAPPEYERLEVDAIVDIGNGMRGVRRVSESPARREARWRIEYAREVLALMEAGAP